MSPTEETREYDRGQRLEARFATMERIISDCRKEYLALTVRMDSLHTKMDSMTIAIARMEASEVQREKMMSCPRHETDIKNLYEKRDSDRRWLLGTLVTAVLAMAGTIASILLKGILP